MRATFLNSENEMVGIVRKEAVLQWPMVRPRVNKMVNGKGRWKGGE
jgi:hypothetical protein